MLLFVWMMRSQYCGRSEERGESHPQQQQGRSGGARSAVTKKHQKKESEREDGRSIDSSHQACFFLLFGQQKLTVRSHAWDRTIVLHDYTRLLLLVGTDVIILHRPLIRMMWCKKNHGENAQEHDTQHFNNSQRTPARFTTNCSQPSS